MTIASVRNIAVLGVPGSIATSALDAIGRRLARFAVRAVSARRQWRPLLDVIRRFRPDHAGVVDRAAALELERAVRSAGLPTKILGGARGLCSIAAPPEIDTVTAAANEIAVAAFLEQRIGFVDTATSCAETLSLPSRPLSSLDDALACDVEARDFTRRLLNLGREQVYAA